MVEVDLGQVRQAETNVRELIDQSFLENMNGAKIMQDAEGNWGLLTPGADAVTPFSSGGGGSLSEIEFPFTTIGITQFMYYASVNTTIFRITKTFPMKKIVVSGMVMGKTSSTSYSRSISGNFMYYEKNADGSKGASKTITLGSVSASGASAKTAAFNDVEINLEAVYFEDAVTSGNNPQFYLYLSGTYAYGVFYLTKLKGYM